MGLFSTSLTITYAKIFGYTFWEILPLIIPISILSCFGANHALSSIFAIATLLRPHATDPISPYNKISTTTHNKKTAILIFVYNESVSDVTARIATMVEDIKHYRFRKSIEWFILSDTRDINIVSQEIYSLFELRRRFPDTLFHYRNRIVNSFAKVGNMGDFIRRFGKAYDYAIPLDADSVMPAKSIIKMIDVMNHNNDIGIIQGVLLTLPPNSLFGDMFAYQSVTSAEMTSASQYYFRHGEASYCGHNSIVRLKPFMEFCHLPVFSKKFLFPKGKFTSHDFVESALLRANGYKTVSLPELVAFDLEVPNFILWAVREQRWLSGALNWLRIWRWDVFFGFIGVELMANALKYFQAILGFVFFLVTINSLDNIISHPMRSFLIYTHVKPYLSFAFKIGITLFIISQICNLIYARKILKISSLTRTIKYFWSTILCFLFSILSSPIKMILVTMFIISWLRSSNVSWAVHTRETYVPSWPESIKFCLPVLVTGLGTLSYIYVYVWSQLTPQKLFILRDFYFFFIIFLSFMIIPMIISPFTVRFTAKFFPKLQKMSWFSMRFPQSRMDYSHLITTLDKEITFYRHRISHDFKFEDVFSHNTLAKFIISHTPSRPKKYRFWEKHFKDKNIQSLNIKEKFLVLRCRELFSMFLE